MSLIEDYDFIECNYNLLLKFINSKCPTERYEHREYLEDFFRDPQNLFITRTILEDTKKLNEEKLEDFKTRFFSKRVIIINGDLGQGKGTTSISILYYFKDYIKNTLKKKIVAFMPCPTLDIIDDYIFSLNDLPNDCILYCQELGLMFPNTDYNSNEAKSVNPLMIKLRQKGVLILGETQTDSIVHIGFYKFLDLEIFRYVSPMKASFKREKNDGTSILNNKILKYVMPEKFDITLKNLSSLTQIILFDDLGFMSLTIPRTENYTPEHSTFLREEKKLFDKFVLNKIHEGYKIKDILKYCSDKFHYKKSPNSWLNFFQKYNIELDKDDLKNIHQGLL